MRLSRERFNHPSTLETDLESNSRVIFPLEALLEPTIRVQRNGLLRKAALYETRLEVHSRGQHGHVHLKVAACFLGLEILKLPRNDQLQFGVITMKYSVFGLRCSK